MSKWTIAKSFEFSYSHRVHSQILIPGLSIDNVCSCRFRHGHNGVINIELEDTGLNEQGMIIDFKNLSFFKQFIDNTIDHKCILDINDPEVCSYFYPILEGMNAENRNEYLLQFAEDYWIVKPELYSKLELFKQEIYQGLIFVNFIPTSENLSKWFFDIIANKLKNITNVTSVEFKETPKTSATYSI